MVGPECSEAVLLPPTRTDVAIGETSSTGQVRSIVRSQTASSQGNDAADDSRRQRNRILKHTRNAKNLCFSETEIEKVGRRLLEIFLC